MATKFSNSTNLDIQRGQLSGPERDQHTTAHRTLNNSLNPTTAANMEPHDQTHCQESKDGIVRQNSTRHSTRPGGPRARKRRIPRQLPAIPPIPDVGPPIRTEPRLDAQVILTSDRAPNRSPNTKQQHGTTDSRTVAQSSTSHPERSSQQENPSSAPKPLPPIASSSKGKGKQVEKPIPSTPVPPEPRSIPRNERLIRTAAPDMPPRHVAFDDTVTGSSQPDNAEGVCVDSDPQVKLTKNSSLEEKQRERDPEEQSSNTPSPISNLPVQRSTSFIPTVSPPAYETAPPASQSLKEKPVFESAGVTSSQPAAAESVGARSTISHPAFQPVKASLPPSSVAFSVLLFVIWLYYHH